MISPALIGLTSWVLAEDWPRLSCSVQKYTPTAGKNQAQLLQGAANYLNPKSMFCTIYFLFFGIFNVFVVKLVFFILTIFPVIIKIHYSLFKHHTTGGAKGRD